MDRFDWRRAILAAACCALCGSVVGQQPDRSPATLPPPADSVQVIPTRQSQFTIPFTIDPVHQARVREVQLYVSADRGNSWSLYDRQAPAAGSFTFRASRDGEYWFALYTLVDSGRSPRSLEPELKVGIDTTEPAVELSATADASGRVVARWQIYDLHPVPKTLRLSYQIGPDQPWQSVEPGEDVRQPAPTNLMGETSWRMEPGSASTINVRLEIKDAADNIASITRRVTAPGGLVSRGDAAPPATPAGSVVDPFAHVGVDGLRTPDALSNPAAGAGDVRATERPDLFTGNDVESRSRAIDWPADNRLRSVAGETDTSPETRQAAPETVEVTDGASRPSALVTSSASPSRNETFREETDVVSSADVTLPPGQIARATKSPRFNLAYDVDSVGASGVARVELWITRNGGRNWLMYGRDEDRTSPFPVNVEQEGVYGFRVIVVNGDGLAGKTPEPGDLADIWIAVDTTPPTVRLTSAVYGTGQRAGILDIRWEAEDGDFGDRPISLSFSRSVDGPWTQLAAGIPNSGQYDWRVDATMPKQVFLRIEARDRAGHVAEHALAEPISLEGLAPQGRIRSFTPVEEARRRRARWR